MLYTKCDKEKIRETVLNLGFDACGFASVHEVNDESKLQYRKWISNGHHAQMEYLARNLDVRDNPKMLLPDANTLIVVALNYYPAAMLPKSHPQFAYYAYGEDYHKVIKRKLKSLANILLSTFGGEYRACVDSAPIRERYWAQEAGIGFVGRNNQLIIPGKGSYFFIGILLTSLVIEADKRCNLSCNNCGKCIKSCPGKALNEIGALDANKCISYLTIEHKGALPENLKLENCIYGCDRCQQVCIHNLNAMPTAEKAFTPSDELMELTANKIEQLTEEEYTTIFSHSAVKRASLSQLKRNLNNL